MSHLYEASPEWLKGRGLKTKDARRLFAALCTLADYEGAIKAALVERAQNESNHSAVCNALRLLVDGE